MEERLTIRSEHDGTELSVLVTLPEGEPAGLIQFSHGMSEHKERYLPFMRYLSEQGLVCVINDHRGHGDSVRNANDLGYFGRDGAAGVVSDLHQITLWMRSRWQGKKLILFGHSMGSLAVRAYADRYDADIDALIVCGSPGENKAVNAGLLLLRVIKAFRSERYRSELMRSMTVGGYGKRFASEGGGNAWLSVNKENSAAYDADPRCGFNFTLNGNEALLGLLRSAYALSPRRSNPNLPVFFYSGADDPCAPDRKGFENAMAVMRRAGFAHVSGYMFPGLRHEILNEKEREQVWSRMYTEAILPVLA